MTQDARVGVGGEHPVDRRPRRATPVGSCQLSSAGGRPSYRTMSGSRERTAVTRAPRASQSPGRGQDGAERCQASPSRLVAYAVDIRSSWPASVSGCSQIQACQPPASSSMITGSLTAISVAGQHDCAPARGEVLRPVGVEGLDPPVLGPGGSAGEVEPPATLRGAEHDRTLERLGTEVVAEDLADLLEREPSRLRATTVETPRPAVSGRRTR